jgi:hypothetical protein
LRCLQFLVRIGAAGALAFATLLPLAVLSPVTAETADSQCVGVGLDVPGPTTACTHSTAGDTPLGAQVSVAFAAASSGTLSTEEQVGGMTANNLTPAQAQAHALGTAGFQTGVPALQCAGTVAQSCQVAGAVSGTLTRTGSTTASATDTLTATDGLAESITIWGHGACTDTSATNAPPSPACGASTRP